MLRRRSLFFLSQLRCSQILIQPRTRYPLLSPTRTRYLHVTASTSPHPPSSNFLLNHNPPGSEPEPETESNMQEFLSRFVHSMRPILTQAFPDTDKKTLDSMLLLICKRVVAEINNTSLDTEEEMIDLNDDLWKTVQEVSRKVDEAMQKDRMRDELKNYLHHDDVKEMCRFVTDVGVRGDMLREFRFKWAREKLEEVEFYRNLEKMREKGDEDKAIKVESLPERKGKFEYKIYGMDLSGEKWKEVAERVEEVESKYGKSEAKEVVGRSKRLEDKFFGLDWEKDDFMAVLYEWAEALEATREDWIALLERIKERSLDMYFKVAELLLTEESFKPNIRDYSKLIEDHVKSDRIKEAQRILQKMTEEAGLEPDVLTHNTLIHLHSKSGDLDSLHASLTTLKHHGFKLSANSQASIFKAYLKAGRLKEAAHLTAQIPKDEKLSQQMHTDLLRAYSDRGDADGAQRTVNTMDFNGMTTHSLEIHTLLVGAYARVGDPDLARAKLDHMVRAGLRPDDRCVALMMGVYKEKNMLDKAVELMLTLKRDGFRAGPGTDAVFVDWLGRLGLVEEAEQMVGDFEGEVPVGVYVSLCDMYVREGVEGKVREMVEVLVGRKEEMGGGEFERAVDGLLSGGFVEEAKRVYEVMVGLGFEPGRVLANKYSAAQPYSKRRI